jgi:hypothetical protein
MKKIYIGNSFSLSMLDRETQSLGHSRWLRMPRPTVLDKVVTELKYGEVVSCVGHADTAAILSKLLGVDLPVNRVSVKLEKGDLLIVGQYVGQRLPEGTTELPEGAAIEWWII